MEIFTDHGVDATFLAQVPPGGRLQATLHADPMLLMALVAVVALAVAGMALYVVHTVLRSRK